ncbi:hypothetical protein [Desulfogranum japonicum]|uniref:hypothetical protein n=1 Tax=Desulfogranum japonicum TaxID=231447 RepID=UPI0004195DF2|nr:hypothetical protein [Desulfogranum japonicum]
MGTLRIVEKGSRGGRDIDFPAFYMNDFSVLGLVVDGLERTFDVLSEKGVSVERKKDSLLIALEKKDRVEQVLEVLSAQNIRYTLSDLVSCAYQG